MTDDIDTAAAPDGYYEPFAFEVGDRVRFRRSAECVFSHGGETDGAIGTVVEIGTRATLGHRYLVHMDGRRWETSWHPWLAGLELDPLEGGRES